MVRVWKSEDAGEFSCPHCAAIYLKRITRFPLRDRDSEHCLKCKQIMADWNSTEVPSFTLKP
jgi:hypothetical protein